MESSRGDSPGESRWSNILSGLVVDYRGWFQNIIMGSEVKLYTADLICGDLV